MKQSILTFMKKPFLAVYWLLKRNFSRVFNLGDKLKKQRKKIYETHIDDFLNHKDESPLNHLSSPPWKIKVSGSCLIFSKYVSTQIYNCARSKKWMEIYGFVLGKRYGNLFIGITFVEVTNMLRSRVAAMPDPSHLLELEREISAKYPDLEIVSTVHSHPSGVTSPSFADKRCFRRDSHPNIIVSPLRLVFGTSINRMTAYYHFHRKIRKIKIIEIDKKEVELDDIDFDEIKPTDEELLSGRGISIEVDFGIYKVWMVSHPSVTVEKLCDKLTGLFGKEMRFLFLYWDKEWIFDPEMNLIDFLLHDGDHLVFPELYKVAIL